MLDLEPFFEDSTQIHHLNSEIPESAFNEPVIVGIDEAGRGPVLGPMVYSAAYCPMSQQKQLDKEKFQDSKTLTEKQRSEMFEMINNYKDIGWCASLLSPMVISNSMLKRAKYNLNALSHDAAITLIKNLQDKGVQVQEVYLDTVGPPEKYEANLKQIFPDIKKIKVAKKADSLYKIVSTASICAKVIRDHIIKNWKFIENLPYKEEEYSSGYPSDPKTKEFLTKVFDPIFGYPTFIRFSWSTITKILDDKAYQCKWDDDDEDEDDPTTKNQSIMNFFKSQKTDKEIPLKLSNFFIERDIEQVENLDKIF